LNKGRIKETQLQHRLQEEKQKKALLTNENHEIKQIQRNDRAFANRLANDLNRSEDRVIILLLKLTKKAKIFPSTRYQSETE